MNNLKCPYCYSTNITLWVEKYKIGIEKPIKVYRCYECNTYFEIRNIEGCGEQTFAYGDNYPVFNDNKNEYPFIIDGECQNNGDYICNLGYTCDSCPYNRKAKDNIPFQMIAREEIKEHEKFKNMGKITREEINDFLIDLWEEE